VPGQNACPSPFIDLGNQAQEPNPFDEPAAYAAGTQTAAPPQAPPAVVDPGVQPDAQTTFTPPPVQPAVPVTGTGDGQTALFAEPQDKTAMARQDAPVFAKLPIFENGAVKEPIEDLNQTFEELRAAKAEDFPELEDGARVVWDVNYGKIRKTVPTPKKTKIGEFKRAIESSKEFLDTLKKDKNKSPDCIVKPRIIAGSKGERLPVYKGIFTSLEDAAASDKVICIFPGRDGKVYEMRKEESGTFITPSGEYRELSEVEAGFIPALPLIPHSALRSIIGFFRSLMKGKNYEALAHILWDREQKRFCTVIPRQSVTAVRTDADLSGHDGYEPERYLHYMDVHSHNVMAAKFSPQDDADEKATRLYAVIGRLDRYIPEISVRIANGGKHLLIDPTAVFESLDNDFPESWNARVTTKDGEESPEDPPGAFSGEKSVPGILKRLAEKQAEDL
jgi:hypothetical protein